MARVPARGAGEQGRCFLRDEAPAHPPRVPTLQHQKHVKCAGIRLRENG
jgi:hypothetical protein